MKAPFRDPYAAALERIDDLERRLADKEGARPRRTRRRLILALLAVATAAPPLGLLLYAGQPQQAAATIEPAPPTTTYAGDYDSVPSAEYLRVTGVPGMWTGPGR